MSDNTGWFSDRPFRFAGQITTAEFLAQWDQGENSFADDPPNADFTCEVEGEVVNYVVELTSPSLIEDDLSYAVDAVGALPQTQITCDAKSHLFIDNFFLDVPAPDCPWATLDEFFDNGAVCPPEPPHLTGSVVCTSDSQCTSFAWPWSDELHEDGFCYSITRDPQADCPRRIDGTYLGGTTINCCNMGWCRPSLGWYVWGTEDGEQDPIQPHDGAWRELYGPPPEFPRDEHPSCS